MNERLGPQRIEEDRYHYRCRLDHYSLMLATPSLWTAERKRGADAVGLAAFDTVIAHERGLISLPDVPLVPLPLSADATLRRVYRELHLLVRCRFFVYPCAPIPLTRRFVSVWCDITPKQARRCVTALEACGVFVRVGTMDAGKERWMILWMPTGYDVVEGVA